MSARRTTCRPLRGALLLVALCLGGTAHAEPNALQKCAAGKMAAAADLAEGSVRCFATGVKHGVPVDPRCLQKRTRDFDDAFAKAERLGCFSSGDADDVHRQVANFIEQTALLLPDPGLGPDGSDRAERCAAGKLVATGRLARERLACEQRAVLARAKAADKAAANLARCIGVAERKLADAFANLEKKKPAGACATADDAPTHVQTTATLQRDVVGPLRAVRFSAVLPVLERSCATTGCHGGGAGAVSPALHLDPFAALVGVPAGEAGGAFDLVAPGDAANSYLLMKVVRDARIEGDPMDSPPGVPAVTGTDVALLRAWIDAGAPAPAFAEVVAIFTARCQQAACHGAVQPQAGLCLDESPYAAVVGVASSQRPALKLVEKGTAASSWLWQKVAGQTGDGTLAHGGLSAVEQSVIAAWISSGAAPPRFASDVAPLFRGRCEQALCHGPVAPQQGLRLDLDPYAAIVGVDSTELTAKLVVPGNHAASYLWRKIVNAPGIFGAQMPVFGGGPTLTAAEQALIASWISAGAAND